MYGAYYRLVVSGELFVFIAQLKVGVFSLIDWKKKLGKEKSTRQVLQFGLLFDTSSL